MVQRDLELFFAFYVDALGGVFQMRAGIWRHDVECILNGVHPTPPD